MAIKLQASYSKKLGLPGFSSHAFSASVEVELGDLNQAGAECARLYGLLQASVDHEIRHTGFVPDPTYGMEPSPSQNRASPHPAASGNGPDAYGNGNGNGNGGGYHHGANGFTGGGEYGGNGGGGNGRAANGAAAPRGWQCSPKQRELIRSIMAENALTDDRVDGLAMQRFGVGLARLNKLQASGLIDELLESFGGRGKPRSSGGNGNTAAAAQGNGGPR